MAAPTVLKLPRLPSNWLDQPNFFPRAWDTAMSQIETLLNQILAIPEIQTALSTLDTTVAQAQVAITAAQTAATQANDAALATSKASSLANSYVSPTNVLLSTSGTTTATVSIAAHTRIYGDGSSVSVNAGTVTGLSLSTLYYIYYDDPSRSGGNVTYMATTDQNVAAQSGDRHTVGSVTTGAASATSSGKVVRPPGVGSLQ